MVRSRAALQRLWSGRTATNRLQARREYARQLPRSAIAQCAQFGAQYEPRWFWPLRYPTASEARSRLPFKIPRRVFERPAHDQLTEMRQSTPFVWVYSDNER